jgi:hypothetical protein
MRRYSSALRTQRRPWITQLDAEGTRPADWPDTWSWERTRPLWLRLYAHAGRVIRGEARSPCAGPADHFGSAEDAHRAWRAGWRQVHCVGVANWFWRVPR